MNITNKQLYDMILAVKTDQEAMKAEFKAEQAEFKVDQEEIKAAQAEFKVSQAELRADIAKWGVALFAGSIVAMTSILGVLVTSILLTTT